MTSTGLVIVGNKPTISLDGEIAKAEVLKICEAVNEDTHGDEVARAVGLVKKTLTYVEDSRKAIKAAPLALCRAIDATFKEYVEPLEAQFDRLSGIAVKALESAQAKQLEDVRQTGVTFTPATLGGEVGLKDVPKYEIINLHEAYLSNPDLFDIVPKDGEIKKAVRAGRVMNFIKGWMESKLK